MKLELNQNQESGAFRSEAEAQEWVEYRAEKLQARALRNFGMRVQCLYRIIALDGVGQGYYQVNYRIVNSN